MSTRKWGRKIENRKWEGGREGVRGEVSGRGWREKNGCE